MWVWTNKLLHINHACLVRFHKTKWVYLLYTLRKEEASRFVYVKTKQTNKLSIITNPTHTPVIYPEWVGVCFDLISLLICQKVIIVLLSGLNIWYWNVSDCVGQIKSTFWMIISVCNHCWVSSLLDCYFCCSIACQNYHHWDSVDVTWLLYCYCVWLTDWLNLQTINKKSSWNLKNITISYPWWVTMKFIRSAWSQ